MKLGLIDDIDAIPAFELCLLTGSEQTSAACVEHLASIKHRKATIALCNSAMSMSDEFHTARQTAITEIKMRPMEDYIPIILGKMQTSLTGLYSFTSQTGWEFSHGPFHLPKKYELWKSIERADVKVSNETFHEIRNYSFGVIFNNATVHGHMVNRNGDIALPLFEAMIEQIPLSRTPSTAQIIEWERANDITFAIRNSRRSTM